MTTTTKASQKTKPVRFGDVNDLVTLEADLAKARETIEKQRAHIRRLEQEAEARLATAETGVAWLASFVAQALEYKQIRDRASELTAANKRAAASFASNRESGAYFTPGAVIDANLAKLKASIEISDGLVSVLEERSTVVT